MYAFAYKKGAQQMKAKAVLQKMLTVGARQEEVTEALAELQGLESYVVGQIGSLSANLESLSFSDKCIVEYQIKAYTDILQKIKGEKC